jgi:hypothetical protein
MNVSSTEPTSESGAVVSSTAHTRLTGSWLILARVLWLSLVIPSVGFFVASLPVYYSQIQRACIDLVTCNIAGALTTTGLLELRSLGFSVSGYAALLTIFFTIIVTIWGGIGFLIFWRRSDEWFALVLAFLLVMFNTTYPGFPISALALAYPALTVPIMFMSMLGLASFALVIVLFPNGRLVPRWMGLFLLLAIIGTVSTALPPASRFNSNNLPWWLNILPNGIVFGAIIFSHIYRYRRVSSRVERQQTKWVVSGIIVVLIGIFVILPIFDFFFPTLNQPNIPSSQIFGLVIYPLLLLSIPVSVGMAILRYRLYDIDILINRTLVYGALTAILALVYFGLIFALQYLLRGIINQQNDVAIVVSTLAIAALFQPLRHRIQAIIDRRFYRRKYDAAKTLEAFSATLRNEVDLNQLREHLLNIVQETMQPAHVSLWLRSPQPTAKQQGVSMSNPQENEEQAKT